MKSHRLRIVWVTPLIFLWIGYVLYTLFIISFASHLREMNRTSIFLISDLIFLFVLIFGSFRVGKWIKDGRI